MNTRYLPFVVRLMIGLPFAMSGLGKLAVAVELGGGLMLILGYQTRGVALALAIFALAAAFSFHPDFADQNQMIHFLKNVMMAGGLLQIVAFGAGALSLDNRLSKDRGASAKAAPAH